jgi:hypothetical protein
VIDITEFRNDFAEIIGDLPVTVLHAGKTYVGIANNRVETEDLMPGGWLDHLDRNTSGTWPSNAAVEKTVEFCSAFSQFHRSPNNPVRLLTTHALAQSQARRIL